MNVLLVSAPPEPPELALMVTTLGEAFTAAAVMALTLSLLLTMTVPGWLLLLVAVEPALSNSSPEPTVATPPPTRPAARMLATRVPTPNDAFLRGASFGFGARPTGAPAAACWLLCWP